MTTQAYDNLNTADLGDVSVANGAMQVVFHRRYAQPIERVWAAVATPERLQDWLAAAEIEPKAGGAIHLTWNKQYTMDGRVTAYQPPHVFAFTWTLDGRETLVRFDLTTDNGGCVLTLTHSNLSAAPRAEGGGVRAGWHAHLEGLPEAIEGRATPWETKSAREDALEKYYPELPA